MASDKLSRRSPQSEDIIFIIIYIISQCYISESVIYIVTIHLVKTILENYSAVK